MVLAGARGSILGLEVGSWGLGAGSWAAATWSRVCDNNTLARHLLEWSMADIIPGNALKYSHSI